MAQQLSALADVIEHYRASGVLHTVNGLLSISEVEEAIDAELAAAGIRRAGTPSERTAG